MSTILDVNGRMLLKTIITKMETNFDVSIFGKGIYVVRMRKQLKGLKIVI
ncbi:hypothetical protein DNU06_07010 [Putridiphycobacter roseus]|uniref:Secretion system C-terminal sorting domain-containing protein n=1 Tax=Putridiphycobacter roseus TaxID=2219161 RepID=A0A2W1NPL5_9FLAO|nr:T9SS type A sorting domain-containing protein [Putridiphycobacter roseus]PZE17572.1 hypothetical protein DNU06_07010 [Putridiphycobacter roseus]